MAEPTAAASELDRARAGDARALGRLLSLAEDDSPRIRSVIKDLLPLAGQARIITPAGALSAAVCAAVHTVTGRAPQLSTGGGTSDGRFIAPLGAQVVELGVVNASIHKVNECVRVEDIDALHAMYLQTLRNLLG